jgi:hypothetical protein
MLSNNYRVTPDDQKIITAPSSGPRQVPRNWQAGTSTQAATTDRAAVHGKRFDVDQARAKIRTALSSMANRSSDCGNRPGSSRQRDAAHEDGIPPSSGVGDPGRSDALRMGDEPTLAAIGQPRCHDRSQTQASRRPAGGSSNGWPITPPVPSRAQAPGGASRHPRTGGRTVCGRKFFDARPVQKLRRADGVAEERQNALARAARVAGGTSRPLSPS